MAPPLLATVAAMGMSNGTARVFGDAAGYAPAGAALLNGALGNDKADALATAALDLASLPDVGKLTNLAA